MIDMSKPYIYVKSIDKTKNKDELRIRFTINGCSEIDEVSWTRNGSKKIISMQGYCNHNVPDFQVQTTFEVYAYMSDTVELGAIVDQNMAKSVHDYLVAPQEFVDDPETHFAKLRLEDDYHVQLNGKHVRGSKNVSL